MMKNDLTANRSSPPILNRRRLIGCSARAFLAATLVRCAQQSGFGGESPTGSLEEWAERLDRVSRDLASGKISALQWQLELDDLYRDVPMQQLLKAVDFAELSNQLAAHDLGAKGEIFKDVRLGSIPSHEGNAEPSWATAIVKIAHVKKGRSIPPHGHSNMTSAFLCLSGEFDVRLYDRLDVLNDQMVVRQTLRQPSAQPGSWSSISDYRNNVHWLTAKADDCFLFTAKLIRLEPDREYRGRINIDLHDAQNVGPLTYRAPIITGRRAAEIY